LIRVGGSDHIAGAATPAGTRAARRSLALSTTLALLLLIVCVGAGAVGADAWRSTIRDQASRGFHRQADAVDVAVRQHLASLDTLFALSATTVEAGRPLGSVLKNQDMIKQYPGVVSIGRAVTSTRGMISIPDEYSAVAGFGITSVGLRGVVSPQLRAALNVSAATGQRTTSGLHNVHLFTSADDPTFYLVQPAAPVQGRRTWIVGLVYGNWMVEDSLQATHSSFRAQLLDSGTVMANDYLPIGALASTPPPPIPAAAVRVSTPISVFGRPWTLVVADADGITRAHVGAQPTMLLLGLSALGLLSGLLVWVLGRSRIRALGMVGEATSELRASEGLVRRSEERFRGIVQYASDAILLVDSRSDITYQSDSAGRLFGYSDRALLSTAVLDLVHPDDRQLLAATLRHLPEQAEGGDAGDPGDPAVEQMHLVRCRVRDADGSWRPTETTVSDLMEHESVGAFVLMVRDVSDRHALEEQLRHQAFHDSLTGLANRRLFAERVNAALRPRSIGEDGIALLLCDLDDFKTVNDSLGHAAGDSLLVQVASRLEGCVRAGDTVARLGGDEFAVLLAAPTSETETRAAAERILDGLLAPVRVENREVVVRSSIGIAMEPVDGADADGLLRDADVAMYLAKAEGKGRAAVFAPSMHAEVVARLAMRADLEGALGRDEFFLHYQPVFDLMTGAITAVEALLRWQHPLHGLLAATHFIGLAEETGYIVDIGRATLTRACRQVAAWQDERGADQPPLRLNFNLCMRQLEDPFVVGDVADALEESGLAAADLTLELTESMLMRDVDAALGQLLRLKELGVRIAVDDFGTGYSSLGYLQTLPIDIVKIDRSFVQALSEPGADPALVRAVVDLAANLGLDTVAEGIEGSRQVELLRKLACGEGQGYHFARPLSPADLRSLLLANAVPAPRGPAHPTIETLSS
jgi:diguanylate cyclase (GGDEF)-like protein/PAS domain S-box-containing protein